MSHQIPMQDEFVRLLLARLDDLCARGARGETAVSPFLTPREAKYASLYLSARIGQGTALLWGGYPAAERTRAVILPDYTEGLAEPAALAADPVAALRAVGLDEPADTLSEAVVLLKIAGSGFRELGHRDYLGSALGLGLERDAIGDILVEDPHTACLVTSAQIGQFLITGLEKVGTDTVKVTLAPEGTRPASTRRLQPISDTVASERLDCVVAALCNLSREKAQTAIRSGLVELDYEPTDAVDETVEAPATISVRGFGKFAVHSFDGTTRKGRVRLLAGKYI